MLYEDESKRSVEALVAALRALQVAGGGMMRRGGNRELRPGAWAAAVEEGGGRDA